MVSFCAPLVAGVAVLLVAATRHAAQHGWDARSRRRWWTTATVAAVVVLVAGFLVAWELGLPDGDR